VKHDPAQFAIDHKVTSEVLMCSEWFDLDTGKKV